MSSRTYIPLKIARCIAGKEKKLMIEISLQVKHGVAEASNMSGVK
jgi:hypothetical protein